MTGPMGQIDCPWPGAGLAWPHLEQVSTLALDRLSDEELMEAYQRGDARAFECLLGRHQRPVYNFIHRQVGVASVAEELLQDVFLRIIKGASTYRRTAKFTTWMYTIARNLCVDHSRRARHRQALSLDQPLSTEGNGRRLGDVVADKGQAVDRQAIGRELRERLQQAIDSLGEDQREVFLMREYLGLPFKEIAEITGCPENTVKSRMRYALEKLREQLEEYRDLAEAVQLTV
jgi:RNA polymerase sigma-70 factor (ECF subfamily)